MTARELQHGVVVLADAKLKIQSQRVRVRKDDVRTPRPKATSVRTVDVPEPALDALRQHLADHPGLPTAPPFTRPDGTELRDYHVRTAWVRARTKAKLPKGRAHDLRHAGPTLAAMSGATLKEVMGRAGHSTVSAAMVYQHNAEHRGPEFAKAMAGLAQAASDGGCAR